MFLTIPETAARLGMSQDTVRRMVKEGDLTAIKGPASNSPYRVSEESLERWIAAHTVQSDGASA